MTDSSPRVPRPLWDEASQAAAERAGQDDTTVEEPNVRTSTAVDLFRGLTIIEVVFHHTSGVALRALPAGTASHDLMLALNRTFHFAVPAFIFLSSMILSRSLLKRFDRRRYFQRRVVRGAWPYLLWSVIYTLWYVLIGARSPDSLLDFERLGRFLLYGKASFHLYFLLVALQVYLIIPLLRPLSARKPGITATFVLGFAVQMLIFALNALVLDLPYPASTALWYALPILLGVAVGASVLRFRRWWRVRRRVTWISVLVAYALYLPLALRYGAGNKVDATIYSATTWLYTSLMALGLLGLSVDMLQSQHRARHLLGLIGTVSLQIYLVHPMILQLLERLFPLTGLSPVAVMLLTPIYALVALALPAALGLRLMNTRAGQWLFGR